jgi:hypothetical protein
MMRRITITEILEALREAFLSMGTRQDLKEKTQEELVEMRRHMPLLVPEDVVEVLPFILADLAKAVAANIKEDGLLSPTESLLYDEQVIMFLDVCVEHIDYSDPSCREEVERVADEQIGGEAGDLFKKAIYCNLARADQLSPKERRDRESRESSFTELTPVQTKAVYLWLRYLEPFYRQDEGIWGGPLVSAIAYWGSLCQKHHLC